MHNKIKVIQLIMSGTSNAGGLFFSVYGLNEELNKNVDIEICFGGEKDKKNEDSNIFYISLIIFKVLFLVILSISITSSIFSGFVGE